MTEQQMPESGNPPQTQTLEPAQDHLTTAALGAWVRTRDTQADRRLLLHLLARCPACYEAGPEVLELVKNGVLPTTFTEAELVLARSRTLAPEHWRRLEEELADQPPAEHRGWLSADPHFPTWGMAQYLAERAREQAREGDLQAARLTAIRARWAAETLVSDAWPPGVPEPWGWELQAWTWAVAGEVERRADDLRAAARHLRRARELWRRTGTDDTDILRVAPWMRWFEGRLAARQQRWEVAAEAFEAAARGFRAPPPRPREAARAGRDLAAARYRRGEREAALEAVAAAEADLDTLDAPRAADEEFALALVKAQVLLELDRPQEARASLARATIQG